jgi:pyocin large subunit-like protein
MRPVETGVPSVRILSLMAAALLGLSACDNGPSAVETRARADAPPAYASERSDNQYATRETGEPRSGQVSYGDRPARTPVADDSSPWAASRRGSGAENAAYHFQRDGQSFGARDVDDYVTKARAFVGHPPRGSETLARPNGDTLVYDPATNTFAVSTKTGEPRAMFKPRDGQTYWVEQKSREQQRQAGRRRDRADDDQG